MRMKSLILLVALASLGVLAQTPTQPTAGSTIENSVVGPSKARVQALYAALADKTKNFSAEQHKRHFGSTSAVLATCKALRNKYTDARALAAIAKFEAEFAPSDAMKRDFVVMTVVFACFGGLALVVLHHYCARSNWYRPAIKAWRRGREQLREWWDPPPPMIEAPPTPQPPAAAQRARRPHQKAPKPSSQQQKVRSPGAPKPRKPPPPGAPGTPQRPPPPPQQQQQQRKQLAGAGGGDEVAEEQLHAKLSRIIAAAEETGDNEGETEEEVWETVPDGLLHEEPPGLSPRPDTPAAAAAALPPPPCPHCAHCGTPAAAPAQPPLPKGWLVFHPLLGVVPQEIGRAHV